MRAARENCWFTGLFGDAHLLFMPGKNCAWPQGRVAGAHRLSTVSKICAAAVEPRDVVRDRSSSSALASVKADFFGVSLTADAKAAGYTSQNPKLMTRQSAPAS